MDGDRSVIWLYLTFDIGVIELDTFIEPCSTYGLSSFGLYTVCFLKLIVLKVTFDRS